MNPRILSVQWSEGASSMAIIEAFEEAALTVAVLDALLEDPALRERALVAMRDEGPTVTR